MGETIFYENIIPQPQLWVQTPIGIIKIISVTWVVYDVIVIKVKNIKGNDAKRRKILTLILNMRAACSRLIYVYIVHAF